MNLSILEEYIEAGDGSAIDNLLHNNPSIAIQKTSHGISPLLLACYYNKLQLVKIIINHLQSVDIYEAAAADLMEDVIEILDQNPTLLDQHSPHGFTPLALATHFGNENIVRYLLRKGANPNLASENGYQIYPLFTAIDFNFEGIAKMLVEADAEVNVMHSSQLTPLHAAAQNGNIEMLILLLERGALVDIQNDFGKTAADLAREKGHLEIAKILST